mgnify:CR=1 FL=1
METFIGCSGYHYSDWKEKFYPQQLQKKEWLKFYARHFNTVEINNTFYKMPQKKDLEAWREQTPSDFLFTLKANRYFTHQKKLKTDGDFKDRFNTFIELAEGMGDQLGCILWQLPGNLHKNAEKIEKLCELFNRKNRHVIEFRHQSWFDDEIYKVLSRHNVTFCIISAPGDLPEECRATSNCAYLRLHGKNEWYNYHYSGSELKSWAERLKQLKNIDRLFVYFNNDQHAHAVDNAKTLKGYFNK